jgi:hypothetical protein|eukprot:COSAG01_NODE_4227_length_5224_cov_4.060683_3_plen_111_part_00
MGACVRCSLDREPFPVDRAKLLSPGELVGTAVLGKFYVGTQNEGWFYGGIQKHESKTLEISYARQHPTAVAQRWPPRLPAFCVLCLVTDTHSVVLAPTGLAAIQMISRSS